MTYLRVSRLDRALVAVGSAIVSMLDPARADMVALLGEMTGGPALVSIQRRMAGIPSGARILQNRPRITAAILAPTYPPGSFGSAYCAYMKTHAFSPDERAEVRFVRDPELGYILQRYREVHDFWHVLSGLPPTVAGEIAIKWLEMFQTQLPMPILSALVAPLRLSSADRDVLCRVYIPWAVRTAREADYLMAVEYEDVLDQPLERVRQLLRFPPAPSGAEGVLQ